MKSRFFVVYDHWLINAYLFANMYNWLKMDLLLKCRCRHGYFHVVNNDYTHWEMYAIGGSAAPTINSQGNRFLAPNDDSSKEVPLFPSVPNLFLSQEIKKNYILGEMFYYSKNGIKDW